MKTTRLITLLLATALLARADVLPPSQDSSSLKGKLTDVTGKATTLAVSATRKGYVHYNLASLPQDLVAGDIVNARLRVYFPAAKKPGDIAIHTVTAGWIETTTALEPGISGSPVAMFPAATVVGKKFVEVDVTATVQAWRTTPATNFGFAFTASGLTNVLIGAKEGAGSGYPCELEIEIERGLGTNLTLGGTTSGAFSGNGSLLTSLNASNISSGTLSLGSNGLSVGTSQLVVSNNKVGVGTSAPATQLDVDGVIGVFDGGSKSRNGGIASELNGSILNFGVNDVEPKPLRRQLHQG